MTVATESSHAIPGMPDHPISVAEYHALINSGRLGENDPVELVEGWIHQKMPQNPHHGGSVRAAGHLVGRLLPSGWYVSTQLPITLEDGEPEPDLSVVSGRLDDYFSRHPGPADIAVAVEVSDSSLPYDRTKARSYARAGIPYYWIINLVDSQVEVYSDPTPRGYRSQEDFHVGDSVPLMVAGRELGRIPVQNLLPPI